MSSESSSKNDASDSSKTQSTTTDTDTEPEKSYYEILNVSTEATQSEIKRAYRSLSLKHHPDKSKDKDATIFQNVNAAYETLRDYDTRRWYDVYGKAFSEYIRKISEKDMIKMDETMFVKMLAVCGSILTAVFVVKFFDGTVYPIEWIAYLLILLFSGRMNFAFIIVSLMSFLLVSARALPLVINVVWFAWFGTYVGSRSSLLDASMMVALVGAVVATIVSLLTQRRVIELSDDADAAEQFIQSMLGEWNWPNVFWSVVGRLLLGLSAASLFQTWVFEVEPLSAYHRDDAHSSVMKGFESLSKAVPARVVLGMLLTLALWRLDGVLGVRLEWFIMAPLLFGLSVLALFVTSPVGLRSLAAVIGSVAALVLAYYVDLELQMARQLLQVAVSGLLFYLLLFLLFQVDMGWTSASRCRAVAVVWVVSLLADSWIHPVAAESGSAHFACMLLIVINWLTVGLHPFPKLLRCVWRGEGMFLEDEDDENVNDEAGNDESIDDNDVADADANDDDADDDDDEDDEEDDYVAAFRAAFSQADKKTDSSNDDDNSKTMSQEETDYDLAELDTKAREFYEHMQLAKHDTLERERLRFHELREQTGRANYELSFESWSDLSSQLGGDDDSSNASDSETDEQGNPTCCVLCGSKQKPMKRCQACMLASYCSAQCQKDDWAAHKQACKELAHIRGLEERFRVDRDNLVRAVEEASKKRREAELQKKLLAQQQQQQQQTSGHSHSHSHGGPSHSHSH